jgi:hypothetical protein
VRSSDSHFVKTSGLRWLSLMLLAPIPWAGRVWALPFLTALAPSARYWEERKLRPKVLTDWARQLVLQVKRCICLPGSTPMNTRVRRLSVLETEGLLTDRRSGRIVRPLGDGSDPAGLRCGRQWPQVADCTPLLG